MATELNTQNKIIKVLIADDHPVVRGGLRAALDHARNIQVVGEACDGLEAITRAVTLRPDVIILDIYMPNLSGLEAMLSIKKQIPDAKFIVMTVSDEEENFFQAIKYGASSYLLKSATIHEVEDAVRKVANGETLLSPHFTAKLMAEFQNRSATNLSERETDVLQLMGEGLTNSEIAKRLFISESTVRTHMQRLLDKLHLRNRAEAIAYATRHRITASQQFIRVDSTV